MISKELEDFLQAGRSCVLGTRDAEKRPECVRVVGVRVERGRKEVSLFLPVATGAHTVANLRDNGRVAVGFSRVEDHRSIQLKGALVSLRDATERDRPAVEHWREAIEREFGWIGLPPSIIRRIAHWPCHAIRFRVESIFLQTPGPGAGDPLPGSNREARA